MLDILLPAIIISILICALHVPLGLEVLKRGIIFIDLAIAQIAGLGVVVAKLYFVSHAHPYSAFIIQASAFGFALGAAALFKYTEKRAPQLQEAIIGSVYIVASSVAVLLLAKHPHGGEEIQAMLAGQILWVGWQEIYITALVFSVIFVLWYLPKLKMIRENYFYFIFAGVVTLSVQLVGIYLVFASLILPALGAIVYKNKLRAGYIISFLSFLLGILISMVADLPTGLMIVCTLAGVTLLIPCISPKKY